MFNLIDTITPEISIRKLKNKHEGKIAVLVGSGPSIFEENTKKFFEKANKEKYIYFTNNHGFLFDEIKNLFKTDYYLISDPRPLEKSIKRIFEFKPSEMKIAAFRKDDLDINEKLKLGFRSVSQIYETYNFHDLGNRGNLILKEFINIPRQNYKKSSIYISLQLILFFGIKKIYLVGCDCCLQDSDSIPKIDNIEIHYRGPGEKDFYGKLAEYWEYIYHYLKKNHPSIDIQVVSPKKLKDIIPEYKP